MLKIESSVAGFGKPERLAYLRSYTQGFATRYSISMPLSSRLFAMSELQPFFDKTLLFVGRTIEKLAVSVKEKGAAPRLTAWSLPSFFISGRIS